MGCEVESTAAAQPGGPVHNGNQPPPSSSSSVSARRLPTRRSTSGAALKAHPADDEGSGQLASVRSLPRELNPAAEGTKLDIPDPNDPAREKILRLQSQLNEIVDGPILSHVRVGMRVIDGATGKTFYRRGGNTLMDPASNQKVLVTTTALMRLGSGFRFRTELTGPPPDGNGVINGDVTIRGMGDPSVRMVDMETLAADLASRGVLRIEGGIAGDPRRIGSNEINPEERTPLRVSRAYITVRVRPSLDGLPPLISVKPELEVLQVRNRAVTGGRGRGLRLNMTAINDKIVIELAGRLSPHSPGLVMRRVAPDQRLFTAALLRRVLIESGIEVRDPAKVFDWKNADKLSARSEILAVHRSEPLSVLVRRINKDSDNEWADRLLDVVGAELFGGAATAEKGLRALREAMDELGLARDSYVPSNGSGLGHANRLTADALAELLHKLYSDPRWGPELMQSLSVGGVDGTTRNRFRGQVAAERVRAKTGTLSGKSCLSGYVGDGHEVLVFSIFVDGIRNRRYTTMAVRAAQVNAVNAMMRFARGVTGPAPGEEVEPGVDFEVGDEILEADMEERPVEGGGPAEGVGGKGEPGNGPATGNPPRGSRPEGRSERLDTPAPPPRPRKAPSSNANGSPIEPEVEFLPDETPRRRRN
jgi:D-alanyl-D-alanine carboxypeptidase/D-alanyl-D-alanine-endopeptidase (penicillin-binding protein 4)